MILALLLQFASAATLDRVAAVVDDDVVALSEIYDLGGEYIAQKCGNAPSMQCRREAEGEILDALIERLLVRHELERLQADVTSDEIERGVDGMVQQYGARDRDELRAQLTMAGISWDDFRQEVAEQVRQIKFSEAVIRPRVTVTENEVQDLYQRTARQYAGPEMADVEVFGLTVPEGADRQAILDRAQGLADAVNRGEKDWKQVVHDEDQVGYAATEGKTAPMARKDVAPAVADVLFNTPAGQVAKPIDAGRVVLVFKVLGIKTSGVRPYEEVEGQLKDQIFQQKISDETDQWMEQKRRSASIRILLDDVRDDGLSPSGGVLPPTPAPVPTTPPPPQPEAIPVTPAPAPAPAPAPGAAPPVEPAQP